MKANVDLRITFFDGDIAKVIHEDHNGYSYKKNERVFARK